MVTLMDGATGGAVGCAAKTGDLGEDGRGETARTSRAEDLGPSAARSRSISAIILSARSSSGRSFTERGGMDSLGPGLLASCARSDVDRAEVAPALSPFLFLIRASLRRAIELGLIGAFPTRSTRGRTGEAGIDGAQLPSPSGR
jgi:hypothetical protein